uniref:Uncharacterized protein n=1 Tax=Pan troglodytes TaxID=9598 RepID=A0A2I3RBL0_PANTR
MNAGPGCEPCTKRPRWGAATTSPAASDARSFPSRQRRVLDPKDAHVQFRVPPSSPACVPGRAGQHRGSATSEHMNHNPSSTTINHGQFYPISLSSPTLF